MEEYLPLQHLIALNYEKTSKARSTSKIQGGKNKSIPFSGVKTHQLIKHWIKFDVCGTHCQRPVELRIGRLVDAEGGLSSHHLWWLDRSMASILFV